VCDGSLLISHTGFRELRSVALLLVLLWRTNSASHGSSGGLISQSLRRTQFSDSAAGSRKPSLWATAGSGAWFSMDFRELTSVALLPVLLWRTKPASSGSSGAWFPEWASESAVLWCCFQENWAIWLALSVTCGAAPQEPSFLLIQGWWFPWHFKVKIEGHVVEESVKLQVPMCAGKQDLPPSKHQVMEPVA
jgi:hypothetical protein